MRKLCPLMIKTYLESIHLKMDTKEVAQCLEDKCAWWNETTEACGMRLGVT